MVILLLLLVLRSGYGTMESVADAFLGPARALASGAPCGSKLPASPYGSRIAKNRDPK